VPLEPAAAAEAAEGADAPPPPVPEAAPVLRGRRRGPKFAPTVVCIVDGGSIAFHESTQAFEATCTNPLHLPRCVATRTCRGHAVDGGARTVVGRPVGFLVAWLRHGIELGSKDDHWQPECWDRPLHERAAAREAMAETYAGRVLLACERPAEEGEAEEPETTESLMPRMRR
jgi:hypothetical protein